MVLESGRIFGGDSWFYYTGSYEADHEQLAVHLGSRRHASGEESVAGSDDESLILAGDIDSQEIVLRRHVASDTQAPR